ncbi:hypothetical protein WJX74_004295 [Apatococcus lobatus]|uniref:Protein kinase domain-containing protein n=1 Tax=Apatococcus lobatus TaxID=904363 RepID=A0AAW1REU2_9CHLO
MCLKIILMVQTGCPRAGTSPPAASLPRQGGDPPAPSPFSSYNSSNSPASSSPRGAPVVAPVSALTPAPPATLPIPQAKSSSIGAIVGGAVGGAVAAIALASLIFCLCWRKMRKGTGSTPDDDNPWAVKEVDQYLVHFLKARSGLAGSWHGNCGAETAGGPPLHLIGPHVYTPSAKSPSVSTQDTIAMVDSDLPAQLRNTWQISLDQLQLVMDGQQRPVTLGKGAYGTVYLDLGILDGVRKVAVKIVNSPTQRHRKRFVQEIATLRACYDSNIVSFLGASVQEGNTLLVMEYMVNGNLWDNLQHDSCNEFRWYSRGRKIALDITAGITEFLHRNDIIHLDLKSPNVLLDENNKAHVADIGLGKMMAGPDALASAATFFWAAPEQL